MEVSGLDIGGSGIKGAPVDLDTGELLEERIRIPTPRAPTSEAAVETSLEVIEHFGWDGPVGVGFPGVIKDGVVHAAANVAKELIGFDLQGRLKREAGNAVRGVDGVVMMLTPGTGIGTALFTQGKPMPNTEFGHIMIRDREAEMRSSDHIRKQEDLSWKKWAKRLSEYLAIMEALFWPGLNIAGTAGATLAPEAVPQAATPG